MSTKTIEPTLDFGPAPKSSERSILSAIGAFFASLRDGFALAHEYERLTSKGVPPQKAIQIVFKKMEDSR